MLSWLAVIHSASNTLALRNWSAAVLEPRRSGSRGRDALSGMGGRERRKGSNAVQRQCARRQRWRQVTSRNEAGSNDSRPASFTILALLDTDDRARLSEEDAPHPIL